MWKAGAAQLKSVAICLSVMVLLWGGSGMAQVTEIPQEGSDIQEEYLHRTWTVENGLPDNRINAILQTRDGYLWAATPWGLARFDGVRFTVFNRANTPAMEKERCLALAEDQAGNLWVLTEDSYLLVRTPRGFKKFQIGPRQNFFGLWADPIRGVWTASNRLEYLFHLEADGLCALHRLPAGFGSYPSAFHRRADGSTWIGSSSGGYWFDPPFQQARPIQGQPAQSSYFTHHAVFLPEGRAYDLVTSVEESRGRLYRIDQGKWDLCLTNWVDNDSESLFLTADRQGNLWMPLAKTGLLRWSPQRITPFKVPLSDRLHDTPLCLQEDRDGNLWYGTISGGLHRLQPRRLRMLSTLAGQPRFTAECLLEAPDGSLWIGTEHGLIHDDRGLSTLFTEADGLSRRMVRSLALDQSGKLWVGTLAGLNYFHNGKFQQHHFPGDWEEGKIRALLAARDGGLWIGTVRGLNRVYEGRQTKFTKDHGLSHHEVLSLLEDRSGDLWVGTAGGGLNRLSWPARGPGGTRPARAEERPDIVSALSTTNGLANNYIRALAQDAEGVLWIGTDHGLHRYEPGRCSVFHQHHGLPYSQITMLLADEAGYLWVGSERGLFRVQRSALRQVALGQSQTVSVIAYDYADGLASIDISGKFSQPASARAQDGRLLIGTGAGVAIFDPNYLPDLTNPPPVVLEQVRANGRIQYDNGPSQTNLPLSQAVSTLTLPPGSGRILEFRYTANAFAAPEKTRFQYRLVGLDQHWIEAGSARQAYYANVPPGAYQFQVRAASKHGVWNDSGTRFAVVLQPFYYQTTWFYLICGALVSLLLYLVVVWRLKELRAIERLNRHIALEAQRKRIARDIHDELGASLTQIVRLGADPSCQPHPHASLIRRMADLAEKAVSNIGEIVWASNPRYDTLEDLVAYLREHAASFLQAASLQYQFNFPEQIPARSVPGPFRRHLLAIVKELLHNIVKHSLATQVELSLRWEGEVLEVLLRDNGNGMEFKSQSQFSNGLTNIRERLAELKGAWNVEAQPSQGTQVRLQVPLPPDSSE